MKSVIFLFFVHCVVCTQIVAYLDYNAQNEDIKYSVLLSIGNPHNRIKMTVDFNYDGLIVYSNLAELSSSWSSEGGGTDIVTFGDEKYRIHIILDPSRSLEESSKSCPSCGGIVGFSSSSFIWQIWSSMSLTSSTVILGSFHSLFKFKQHECNSCIVSCIPNVNGGLCATEGHVNGVLYKILFSSEPFTFLPEDFFYDYILNKNIYDDNINKWDPLVISFKGLPNVGTELLHFFNSKGAVVDKCLKSTEMKLYGKDLVIDSDRSHKKLLLRSHTLNDTVILGLTTLSHAIIHYDSPHNLMIIKKHEGNLNHSEPMLLAIAVLFWLFIRWECQDTSFFERDEAILSATFDAVNEIISVPIVITVYAIRPTSMVMKDFKEFYILTGVLIAIESIIIMSVVVSTFYKSRKLEPFTGFEYNYVKRSLNCIFSATGIWLAMVEKRTDSLGNLITFFVQGAIIYLLFYYIILALSYYYYVKKIKGDYIFALYSLGFLPLLAVYYIPTSAIYFVIPLCRYYASQVLEELYVSFVLIFYLLILILAINVVNSDIELARKRKIQ
jgi:hypothetical protein